MNTVTGIPSIISIPPGVDLNHLTLDNVHDIMIQVYVPEAVEFGMSREEALALAQERDLERARQLVDDFFCRFDPIEYSIG